MTAFNGDVMSISDKLSKIKKGSAELNAKTDAFNATIEHIDKGLLGAGVEFWWWDHRIGEQRFRHDGDQPSRTYFILGYTKIGSEWCLAAREIEEIAVDDRHDDWDSTDEHDPVPLKRAPRRVRIEAAPALERFLDALNEEIARMTKAVDGANALVNERDIESDHAKAREEFIARGNDKAKGGK